MFTVSALVLTFSLFISCEAGYARVKPRILLVLNKTATEDGSEFSIDWGKGNGHMNVTCAALSVKGQIVISGNNPEIQSVIGSNTLNGEGRVKIKLENTNFNIDVSIHLEKRDGEIYLKISNKNIKYTYDIGNMHIITEKIIIGNTDLSQIISSYVNDNWRSIMKQFGSVFIDKALELFVDLVASVCDKVPANKYFSDDLNSYLKN